MIKFKVGDRVHYIGNVSPLRNEVGTITGVSDSPTSRELYDVQWDNGNPVVQVVSSDLELVE